MKKDCKYNAGQMAEAYDLLKEMQNNCVKNDTDAYDDPKRKEKYKALEIALYSVNRMLWE